MNRKLILAAALAAGSLVGVAQAAPAVVAGTYYGGQTYYGPPAQTYDGPPAHTYYGPPAYSYNGPTVYVQAAPPAPIYEPMPAPRPGFVWSPGYHDWRDGRYVWLSGHWMPARAGYAWRAPEWQRRDDGSWSLVGGTWIQRDNYSQGRPYGDRDRDGVPNYYDRNDRNPYRY